MDDPASRRRCCLNCHFLMRWNRINDGSEYKFEIAREQRERLAAGEDVEQVLAHDESIACFQNVWDWANRRSDSSNDLREVISTDRGESCFFYPHTPGMFFPAAAELERRATERREAKRDRHVAKWGIIIGLASAVIGAALGALLTKLFG